MSSPARAVSPIVEKQRRGIPAKGLVVGGEFEGGLVLTQRLRAVPELAERVRQVEAGGDPVEVVVDEEGEHLARGLRVAALEGTHGLDEEGVPIPMVQPLVAGREAKRLLEGRAGERGLPHLEVGGASAARASTDSGFSETLR
jgi:hypothetical protein